MPFQPNSVAVKGYKRGKRPTWYRFKLGAPPLTEAACGEDVSLAGEALGMDGTVVGCVQVVVDDEMSNEQG